MIVGMIANRPSVREKFSDGTANFAAAQWYNPDIAKAQ
jgi:hypothetical protein